MGTERGIGFQRLRVQAARQQLTDVLGGGGDAQTDGVGKRAAGPGGPGDGRRHGVPRGDGIHGVGDGQGLEAVDLARGSGPDGGGALGDHDPLGAAAVQRAHRRHQGLVVVQRPAQRLGQLFAVGFDDIGLQVQDGKQAIAAEIKHGGARRPFQQLAVERVGGALRQRADEHDDGGAGGQFGVHPAERIEFLGREGAAVFHQFGDRAGGLIQDRRADSRCGTGLDPAVRHSQGGEFGFDLRQVGTADRGQRQTRAAQMMRADARVEHLAGRTPNHFPRPIHLAVTEGIEDENLLPGRGQTGG